jgi:hypothetical protein
MRLIVFIMINVYGVITLNQCSNGGSQTSGEIPPGQGISWLYPGDEGIENHPSVVFADNFETGDLGDIEARWGHMSNRDGKVMSFSNDVPEGSAGTRSLQMTATRGENAGGELYRTFYPGWDTLYLRFYTKFAADHGSHHHFVSLRGSKKALPAPMGDAGRIPDNYFTIKIEPAMDEHKPTSSVEHPPPGVWQFYAYWPEMRSWQTPEGKPAGRPSPYYGNPFQPDEPAFVPRDEWIAVEVMLKLNTSPDKHDGELALWINGEPTGHFGQGFSRGYWLTDRFRKDPGHPDAAPFEGFRWRHDMDVKINVLRLQHYVSGTSFNRSARYSDNNPDYLISKEQATVLFDNVVLAKEYIGPIRPGK